MTVRVFQGFSPAECRTCHAPILWAETLNGGRLCFEGHAKPLAQESFIVGARMVLVIDTAKFPTHWEKCPDAAAHRKAKR